MTYEEILGIIYGHAREVLPMLADSVLSETDCLADLGANSVDRVEIVALTLHSLSLRLPMVATREATNLGELAQLLFNRRASLQTA